MLSVSGLSEGDRLGGGQRGEIQVFSAASRYRLFRQLHQLSFETMTFLTLTYPAVFPDDPRKAKANLKEWRRRFEIVYGKIRAVWRMEFQARGAPHFHIMYLDCPFLDLPELLYTWKSICHSWDMAHELLGVDIKLIVDREEQRLIASYLGKYIAKVDERTEKLACKNVGRWWGRWNILDQTPFEIEMSDREAISLVDFVLSSGMGGQGWSPVDPSLCTVFGSSMGGSKFGEFIRRYETYRQSGCFREPS